MERQARTRATPEPGTVCRLTVDLSPQHLLGRDERSPVRPRARWFTLASRPAACLRPLDVVDQTMRASSGHERAAARLGDDEAARGLRRPRTRSATVPPKPHDVSSARHSHGTCARRSGSQSDHVIGPLGVCRSQKKGARLLESPPHPLRRHDLGEVRARAPARHRPRPASGWRRGGRAGAPTKHTLDRAGVPERLRRRRRRRGRRPPAPRRARGRAPGHVRRTRAFQRRDFPRRRPGKSVERSLDTCSRVSGDHAEAAVTAKRSHRHAGVRPSHLEGWGQTPCQEAGAAASVLLHGESVRASPAGDSRR